MKKTALKTGEDYAFVEVVRRNIFPPKATRVRVMEVEERFVKILLLDENGKPETSDSPVWNWRRTTSRHLVRHLSSARPLFMPWDEYVVARKENQEKTERFHEAARVRQEKSRVVHDAMVTRLVSALGVDPDMISVGWSHADGTTSFSLTVEALERLLDSDIVQMHKETLA